MNPIGGHSALGPCLGRVARDTTYDIVRADIGTSRRLEVTVTNSVRGGVPVHDPSSAVSVSPSPAVPEIVGVDVLAGIIATAPAGTNSADARPTGMASDGQQTDASRAKAHGQLLQVRIAAVKAGGPPNPPSAKTAPVDD